MEKKNRESVVNDPIYESHGGVDFSGAPNAVPLSSRTPEIVATLNDYMREADENRRNGLNPRDDKWAQNLDLYWNRYDFSNKASWQSKEAMPEVPGFVDRFAAALKEALIQTPEGFYTVLDPADKENDLASGIKRAMDVWLSTTGRNSTGQLLPYSAVFEEQMKMGAMMMSASVTTWKEDVGDGRVAVETVDPRNVWLDHTGRNLYRIRRVELDRHEIAGLKSIVSSRGEKLFDESELAKLESSLYDKRIADEERTGTAQNIVSGRRPVQLDEYIATVVGNDGALLADRSLMVLANNSYLIRGPEKNPFWHGKDWLTVAPLITVPLSVYGRSYMEDFGSVAKTFNNLTNMIIDAVYTSSLKMFAMVPEMLLNPNQMATGATPNKIWQLEGGFKAQDFAQELTLGNLSADSVKVWQAMKTELTEAAKMNEVGLGQFAPNSRTSATEITETSQSSSALIRSVAQTAETRLLDPQLDLVWKTGMQHVAVDDPIMIKAVGEEMWAMMMSQRRELIRRPITFQARGISALIARSQQMKTLMNVLSVVGANEVLMQEFLKKVDLEKLINLIFKLSGIDLTQLTLTDREKMVKGLANPMQQVAGQGTAQPAGPGQEMVGQAVSSLGVGK